MKYLFPFLFIPFASYAQWTNNTSVNTPVCIAGGNQEDSRIVSDGTGGAIMVWMDSRPSGNTDIYVQRLDSAGIPKWQTNGVPICTESSNQSVPVLVEDGNGGAIISWKDLRNGNSDIFAQRVNNSGVIQWALNGIAVDTKTKDQLDPKIVEDGNNGAIITWQDSVSGNWDIYAQRINSSGVKQWSAGGVAVCTAANEQKNPKIATSGTGETIIVWQDKRNGNDYNIYAQKLNSGGTPQWASNGVSVCNSSDTQNNPKVKNDGTGGAIIGWADKRNGNDYNIYAQRLNSSGAAQWQANGIPISLETGNQSAIDISTQNINGAIFTWKDYRNNIYADIYAQYIDNTGIPQWAVNGIPVSTKSFDQINPNIITDSTAGIIVWQDSGSGTWDIYAQKIFLNGTSLWGTNGKVIGNAPNIKSSPKQISDGRGGIITIWQDLRDTGKFDIYAQNVHSDGTLGGLTGDNNLISEDEFVRIFPNPNCGIFEISLINQGELHGFEINIFNALEEIVFHKISKGLNNMEVNISNHPQGIYFYTISDSQNLLHSGKVDIY